MLRSIDEVQKLGRGNMEVAMRSFGVMSKASRQLRQRSLTIRRARLEEPTAAMEKLMAAKTMQGMFEVQSEYAKTAYEGFIARASRMGQLYADLAKESCQPFESIIGKKNFDDLTRVVQDCSLYQRRPYDDDDAA